MQPDTHGSVERGGLVRALLMVSDVSCSGEEGIVPDAGCDEKRAPDSVVDLDDGIRKNWPEDSRPDASNGIDASGHGGGREVESEPTSLMDSDGELGSSLGRLGVGGENASEASPTTARKASPGEFELLKVIGMGAFGKVLQASSTLHCDDTAVRCVWYLWYTAVHVRIIRVLNIDAC